MSVLAELLGGIAELFTPVATVSPASRSTRAAVLIDGLWEEGSLQIGDTRLVWDKRIVFSEDEGTVELVTVGDAWTIDPNLVVLHYRRDDEVVQLAVPEEFVERIRKVLAPA